MSPTGRKSFIPTDSLLSMIKAFFTGVVSSGMEAMNINVMIATVNGMSKYSTPYSLIFSRVSVSSSTACVKARFE